MTKLLEQILDDENMELAQHRVYANKGAGGVDGVTIEELSSYMGEHWESIRAQIQERKYKPQPVLRVEIPKPNGGVRNLGIPTVVDRTIQQAIAQVLMPIFDCRFSRNSYGFRPNKKCEQAITQLLEYFNDGYTWIVDIDLEKFFDNVPQDKLMSFIHEVINDADTESLIRKFLQAGVMVKGEYEETTKGASQGSPLSPLLSNIMLDKLDKELEARGLNYTRYADDCVVVTKSEAAAKRVMHSITEWIEKKLGLKVNAEKTRITTPGKLKYLGFGFWKDKDKWRSRPHTDSIVKYKRRIKRLCKRNWSVDLDYRIKKLNEVTRGWINYFAKADMKAAMTKVDSHLMTQLRVVIWKQWKVPSKREWGLRKLGIKAWQAHMTSYVKGYVVASMLPQVKKAISKEILTERKDLVSPLDYYLERHALKQS